MLNLFSISSFFNPFKHVAGMAYSTHLFIFLSSMYFISSPSLFGLFSSSSPCLLQLLSTNSDTNDNTNGGSDSGYHREKSIPAATPSFFLNSCLPPSGSCLFTMFSLFGASQGNEGIKICHESSCILLILIDFFLKSYNKG